MNNYLIWVWVAAGVIFFVAEIFTAGFFLVCFGVGALAAAVAAALGLDLIWQLAVFIGVSVIALFFVRLFAARVTKHTVNPVGIDRVIGQHAVVLVGIDPLQGAGMVRVAQEEWRARSADGLPIPKQAEVEVLAVEGTRLIVKPLQHPDLAGAVVAAAAPPTQDPAA